MKPHPALHLLIPLLALLALAATLGGLLWPGGPGPSEFTTLHAQAAELDGRGLYAADTVFIAAAFRGTDLVTLVVFVPLLLLAHAPYRRGSLRGLLVLAGVLCYFLYNAVTMAFAAAYNQFFLVYVAYLPVSLFAFILVLLSIDYAGLPARLAPRLPWRGAALFLAIAGLAPLALWLSDVIASLLDGRIPELLGPYTTIFTYAIDLGLIVPAVYLAAWLLWRRAALGYVLGLVLLVLLAGIGLAVVGQTAAQVQAGIVLSPGVFVGFVGSWVVLALIALAFIARLLRALDPSPAPSQHAAFPRVSYVEK